MDEFKRKSIMIKSEIMNSLIQDKYDQLSTKKVVNLLKKLKKIVEEIIENKTTQKNSVTKIIE